MTNGWWQTKGGETCRNLLSKGGGGDEGRGRKGGKGRKRGRKQRNTTDGKNSTTVKDGRKQWKGKEKKICVDGEK